MKNRFNMIWNEIVKFFDINYSFQTQMQIDRLLGICEKLMEAIKFQDQKIEALKSQIQELETRLKSLEFRNDDRHTVFLEFEEKLKKTFFDENRV